MAELLYEMNWESFKYDILNLNKQHNKSDKCYIVMFKFLILNSQSKPFNKSLDLCNLQNLVSNVYFIDSYFCYKAQSHMH